MSKIDFDKIIEENSTEFIEFANEFHYYRKEDVLEMLKQACNQVLDEVSKQARELEDKFPYKKPGDRDSYSQYREGIVSGIDLLEQSMEKIKEEL